jgi:hypothetical protein
MPLALNDDEYSAVMTAAAPIHASQRGAFLKALAEALEKQPTIGAGSVHRAAAEIQRRFVLDAQRVTSAEPRQLRERQASG